MNLVEIEKQIESLKVDQGFDLIYDLLRAYGLPKASIARLRNGSHNRSQRENECLWKGKVYYRYVQDGEDLHDLIDNAKVSSRIIKERPRFLIVRDRVGFVAIDMQTETSLDTTSKDLRNHFEFFLPWAGIEKIQLENLNYADIKAAEKMARLYDEIIDHNEIRTAADVHSLNVFFSRLLFCFFAEDTKVFRPGQFTNAIATMTEPNGGDVHRLFDELFRVLDTDEQSREGLPIRFRDFGYVNGNLFNQQSASPNFSAKARRITLECGTLDWSKINPDIFGSMIQAVVHPSQRESLGMHYTSVENIMKVIRPLFLDELRQVFDDASSSSNSKRLQRLLNRIAALKVFDPACGSGNFLVIAYKELRKLEHQILTRLIELEPTTKGLFSLSQIKLENFYGVEIDDFAHEIAILSLWLAKHQMNLEFHERFGVEISLIPLQDTGNVTCANAATTDWTEICPVENGDEVYVLGNPPYLGARLQNESQKSDLQGLKGFERVSNDLDYVAIWFLKGAQYVVKNNASLAFVSTNSVCQGEQVAQLWPTVYALGADISFAVQSFKWTNNAKGNAGVFCVVIGLTRKNSDPKTVFSVGTRRSTKIITPYLTPGTKRFIVRSTRRPISKRPEMTFGSMPNDGGHLILDAQERNELVEQYPSSNTLIRKFVGAREFIDGIERFALWINDADLEMALSIPPIAERIARVESYRGASKRGATKRLGSVPYRFGEIRHKEGPSIIVPRHSSERREYIPIGFLDQRTVISDAAMAIYGAEPWVFGLLQSRMHMVWMTAISGRLETRYRYSAEIVYNTFPLPELGPTQLATVTKRVFEVLDAREQFADETLGKLYDSQKMPEYLRNAHRKLDMTVDRIYRETDFDSEEERLEMLFEMYEETTGNGELIGT